ncbi:MAG: ATP-binding region, ATPase-like [uncultured Truepera sp.]|uniref:Oxygen sensor histidine kinase NreB n=1 Tax=uncultured Truepera sp. TaxID=543023 RepID=A0A6J4V6E1_9DEIN|nr:MAG: ATP-binding region, ATPase-like [uncultured Truepera sp.]
MQKVVATRSVVALARAAPLADDASERRFDRSSLLIVGLALLLLLFGVAQKAYRLSLPTTGWSTATAIDSVVPVFERNLLGLASPVRSGDVLTALEGHSLSEIHARAAHFQPTLSENYQPGERVRVTVERAGQRLNLDVPLYRWTAEAISEALWISVRANLLTLLGFVIAAFVFWQRPQITAARLLFLFYVVQLIIPLSRLMESQAGHSISDLLSPRSYVLAILFGHLIYVVLLAPLILHLCLSFPKPKAFLESAPWLLVAVYLVPWAWIFFSALTTKASGQSPLYTLAGLYSLLGSGVFLHTFVTVQDPLRRAQVRWVALGFAVMSLSGVLWALGALGILRGPPLDAALAFPTSLVLTLCLALAVLRYRLFDIDLVINRTLVYTALSACVVGTYVLIVGMLGALFNAQGNLAVSLVATGLVAVLFQPLREHVQRFVNRLMYGDRDDPYTLLAKLSSRTEGSLTPEGVLPTLLETVTQALKLPYASVLLYRGESEEVIAEHGDRIGTADPVVFPLTHQGETFGELRFKTRGSDETFSQGELALLRTIAQQVSVAAYAVRQTLELRRSRERLITTREEERLRIRRDLHDGLGPALAGLNLQASSLKHLMMTQPDAAQAAVDELRSELRKAVSEVRQVVHDLRPPSLDQLGLKGALEQLAEGLNTSEAGNLSFTSDISDLPTLPPATEVAVYRVVQEALANALKHARARHVAVTLSLGCDLSLTIQDDGVGIPEHYRAGVGLRSMRERVEELQGSFEIISRSQQGTTVQVGLPYDGV